MLGLRQTAQVESYHLRSQSTQSLSLHLLRVKTDRDRGQIDMSYLVVEAVAAPELCWVEGNL